jgi:protein involved in polysaccharide export with SLBB domain
MKLPRRYSERILTAFCSALASGLLVTGCATSSDPAFTSEPATQPVTATGSSPTNDNPAATPKGQGVIFQVGDMIIITFSDTSETILPHQERIKEDGNITLPLIGAVKASGKSPGELQKEIRDRYVPKYYVRLNVTVPGTQDLTYSVLGEVRAPGPKPYSGKTTVTKAIGAAGGLTEFARKSKLVLTRANGTKVVVNYNKAIEDPKFDPEVFPGDSINVVKSWW